MTDRKHITYALWMKFRNTDWGIYFKVSNASNRWPSPIWIIEKWMEDRGYLDNDAYWERGRNWMILPEGKKPAPLYQST